MPATSIRVASPADYEAVRAGYASWGYPGTALATDVVFIAESGARVIGIVRRTIEHGITMLRGMHVAPESQHKGVGTLLLHEFVRQLGAVDCTCVPYTHLESWYGRVGFVPIEEPSAAAFLRERLAAYRAQGRDMILMRRPATGSSQSGPDTT